MDYIMSTIFCRNCGCAMHPKRKKDRTYFVCRCGYEQLAEKDQAVFKEKAAVRVIDTRAAEYDNLLAVHEHKCKKCGYNKAECITFEPWYSDEDGVVRYRCGKCGKVEQAEGKTT